MLSDYWLPLDVRRLLPKMPSFQVLKNQGKRIIAVISKNPDYIKWKNEIMKAQEVVSLRTSIWDKIIRHDLSLVAEKLELHGLKIESRNDKYHRINFRNLIICIPTIENIINECNIYLQDGVSLQGVYTSLKDFKNILDEINLPEWYTDIEICERVNRSNCAKQHQF